MHMRIIVVLILRYACCNSVYVQCVIKLLHSAAKGAMQRAVETTLQMPTSEVIQLSDAEFGKQFGKINNNYTSHTHSLSYCAKSGPPKLCLVLCAR
jgi:aspartate aminotransferase-like enzyme